MSIEYFLKLLSRYGVLLVVGLAAGLGAASFYVTLRSGYETRSLVLVVPPASVADRVSSNPERFMLTQEKIVTSDGIIRAAAGLLSDTSPAELESAILVEGGVLDDTMTITARADTPELSRDRVDAVTEAYATAAADTRVDVEVLRVEPTESAVSRTRVYVAGGLAGALLALLGLLVIGFLRRPILGTGAWLGDQRYGTVFPYRIRTRSRTQDEDGPEAALVNWLLAGSPNTDGTATFVLHGVPKPAQAEALAASIGTAARRMGHRAVRRESQSAPAPASSTDAQVAAEGPPDMVMRVWHASAPNAFASTADSSVMVVKQGTPLRRLEQALKLSPSGAAGRIVVVD